MKKVSFIMPVYNAAPYVAEAIRSVLSQSYRNIELVIVNDGSTDTSYNVIQFFLKRDDRGIITYAHQKNKGPASAMNKGMDISTGDIILFAAADDIQDSDRAEIYAGALEKADWGYSGYWHANVRGQAWEEVKARPLTAEGIRNNDTVSGGAIGITRKVLDGGIRYRESLRLNEDMAFAIDLYKSGLKYALIDIPTFRYRLLPTGLSFSRKREVEEITERLAKEL